MIRIHRLRIALAGIALSLAIATPAAAGDNTAVAVNTKDGSSLFRLAFSIRPVMQSVVTDSNAAVAYSSCTDCRTIAIAFQVLLLTGDVESLTSENVAMAINYECASCETFAGAYQIIFGTGGPVRFTRDGRLQIRDIRRELRALRDENLSPAELAARLDDLRDRLKVVLQTELVPARPADSDDAGDAKQNGREDDAPESGNEESPGTAGEPDGDADGDGSSDDLSDGEGTPTPDADGQGDATPTATATGTPTPTPTP